MWVIFEGLDKSGKGTLEWSFLKETNFRHIVIDRGPAGYATFDSLFGRLTRKNKDAHARSLSLMRAHPAEFLVVYCKVSTDIAMQRIQEHNETCPYDYKDAQSYYDMAIDVLYKEKGINVIEIDTSKPIDECTQAIVKKVHEMMER